MSTLPDIPREIVEALENRLVVPFVGAGVSVNVKGDGKKLFPNWKELFERMIGEGVGGGDGQAAADALRSQGLCKERGVRRAGTVAGERVGRLDHCYRDPATGECLAILFAGPEGWVSYRPATGQYRYGGSL